MQSPEADKKDKDDGCSSTAGEDCSSTAGDSGSEHSTAPTMTASSGDLDQPPPPKKRLTKSEKKRARFEGIREHRRAKRKEKRRRKTPRTPVELKTIPKLEICLDLSFCSLMTEKEQKKLVRQLGRVRGLQKRYIGLETVLHSSPASFLDLCQQQLNGFYSYGFKLISGGGSGEEAAAPFPDRSLVYLTPDAEVAPLEQLEEGVIYVVGGLVDETGRGPKTKERAESLKRECRRLPIQEHMKKAEHGTFNLMLTINQVFEILCRFADTKNWPSSLGPVVPKRSGYFVEEEGVKAEEVEKEVEEAQ